MKSKLITAVAVLAFLTTHSIYADDFVDLYGDGKTAFDINNTYISLMAGYSLPTDSELESVAGISGPFGEVDIDNGYLAGIALGKTLDNFRFEFEATYRKNDIDSYKPIAGVTITPTGSQEIDTYSFMLNGFVDLDITDSTTFFIGGGIGVAYIDVTANAVLGGAVVGNLVSDDDWVMAYQGMAGFSYELTRHTKLFVQYRLFTTEDPSFTNSNVYDASLSHEIVAVITVAW